MLPLHPWLRCARFCHWPPSASPLRSFACCTGTLLTRVARPPPLDARLHLPFVTSTHRSILGVTFAAESALNQCPCSASIGRATPLSRYSSSFATSTLPHPFTTYSHDDLLYPVLSSLMPPLSRAFIIALSQYRNIFAPHVAFRVWLLSAFIAPAHLLNAICTTWFDISYIALVSPVALIYYHHRLPATCNDACSLPRAPPVLSRPTQTKGHRQSPSI